MEPMTSAKQWIDKLGLRPHPEGGYFRETYRAGHVLSPACLPATFGGERAMSTAIYYLLEASDLSALHRVRQDEVLHYYDGAALIIHVIDPAGNYSTSRLGRNLAQGEVPQVMVPGGHLFGFKVSEGGAYTLLGATVAPGFDFADFEMPGRAELVRQFPAHRGLIESLTRP
jgi:predicted cupin superfamily sugar epimerase